MPAYQLNRRRRRRNPAYRLNGAYRMNPGKGSNTLLLVGLAAGGFFLYKSGMFGGGTTYSVPTGFTQIAPGVYRSPTGVTYTRDAQGRMIAQAGQSGVSTADRLITGVAQQAPQLIDWVRGLFSSSPSSATTPRPGTSGTTSPSASGSGGFTLPPLAPIASAGAGLFNLWQGSGTSLPPLSAGGDISGAFPSGETPLGDPSTGWGIAEPAPLPELAPLGDPDFGWSGTSPELYTIPEMDWTLPELETFDASMDWGSGWETGFEWPTWDVDTSALDALAPVEDFSSFDWGDWGGFMGYGRRRNPTRLGNVGRFCGSTFQNPYRRRAA